MMPMLIMREICPGFLPLFFHPCIKLCMEEGEGLGPRLSEPHLGLYSSCGVRQMS